MRQITLRGIPDAVFLRAQRESKRSGTSLNKAFIALLEGATEGGKREPKRKLHHDLDDLAGSWNSREAEAFEATLAAQRTVDGDLWKS